MWTSIDVSRPIVQKYHQCYKRVGQWGSAPKRTICSMCYVMTPTRIYIELNVLVCIIILLLDKVYLMFIGLTSMSKQILL